MKNAFDINFIIFIYLLNFVFLIYGDNFKEELHDMEADDYQYDHHVILGRDQSAIFDKLTPDESKAKLSDIIDKMDLDHDGKIHMLELTTWIKNVFAKMLNEDVDYQWKEIVKQDVDKIDFETYLKNAYKGKDGERTKLVKLDQRRWAAADLDKDDLLNKTELFRFLHPEKFKDLKPLLAQESLEEFDKNHDGVVDIDEYLKDYLIEGREVKKEWIQYVRQSFGIERDYNKDGVLEREEIESWLLSQSYDRVQAEAEHLMDKAGVGDDKVLTKKEMLEKYHIFVGSHNDKPYGEFLNHEDL